MIQQRETDWRTILLATGAAGGAVLIFAGVAFLLVFNGLEGVRPTLAGAHRSALDLVVLCTALIVIAAVLIVALYYSIVKLSGRTIRPANPRLLKFGQALLLIVIWAAAAAGAGFLFDKPIIKWITPLLYALAIAIPVYFFVRLATGGLHPGSRQRLWGVLATGIELGIAPAIIAEVMLVFIAVIALVIYLAIQPGQLTAFEQLASELENAGDMQQVLNAISPWLTSPLTLLLALLFFSGLAPLIEETAKSLAVWSVFDRLSSPAQGFALGALSGAAFGLVESLLVSATPDSSWTLTLLVRGASTMMHIMAASLTGWGIGQFRVTHRWSRLLGMYFLAFALHGVWNGSVVAITFGSLHTASGSSGLDMAGGLLTFLGGSVLLLLCLMIPAGMWAINRRFRSVAEPAAAPGQSGVAAEAPGITPESASASHSAPEAQASTEMQAAPVPQEQLDRGDGDSTSPAPPA